MLRLYGAPQGRLAAAVARFAPQWRAEAQWKCRGEEMNIPLTIQELGTIAPEEYFAAIDKMADAALADACTVNNPRVPTKEDIIKIYTKLWSF